MARRLILILLVMLGCTNALPKSTSYGDYAKLVVTVQTTRTNEFVRQYCYTVADVIEEAFVEISDKQQPLGDCLQPHLAAADHLLDKLSLESMQAATFEQANVLIRQGNNFFANVAASLDGLPATQQLVIKLCRFVPQVSDTIEAAVKLTSTDDPAPTQLAYQHTRLLGLHGIVKIFRAFVLAAAESDNDDWETFCLAFSDVVAQSYHELGDRIIESGKWFDADEIQERKESFDVCVYPFIHRMHEHLDEPSAQVAQAIMLRIVERFSFNCTVA